MLGNAFVWKVISKKILKILIACSVVQIVKPASH